MPQSVLRFLASQAGTAVRRKRKGMLLQWSISIRTGKLRRMCSKLAIVCVCVRVCVSEEVQQACHNLQPGNSYHFLWHTRTHAHTHTHTHTHTHARTHTHKHTHSTHTHTKTFTQTLQQSGNIVATGRPCQFPVSFYPKEANEMRSSFSITLVWFHGKACSQAPWRLFPIAI